MKVPYRMIIEEQEYDQYAQVINPEQLLILDPLYKEKYELLDEYGLSKSTGPGPARNFAWDHSVSEGHNWHWVIDDNVFTFFRRNNSLRDYCGDGTMFRVSEDFVLRYENVAMAGPDYESFTPPQHKTKPFLLNTRIYSCNLIRNDIPFRWRGRYNEDTILSLDVLKAGWCTILFKAFLQKKTWTQQVKGGNTKEFYDKEGTIFKSRLLVRIHPDCARLVWKFQRWHHEVDYKRFLHRNRLKRKPGVKVDKGINNYGMKLQDRKGGIDDPDP